MNNHNYYEWNDFKNVYLEDSYVLKIEKLPKKIIFYINIVLHENHPSYSTPLANEHYCFKKGKIIFNNIKSINWLQENDAPAIDANGVIDVGNIDAFKHKKEGYYLEGTWGRVIIKSDPPKLELDN